MTYDPKVYRENPTDVGLWQRLDNLRWKRLFRSRGRYENPLPTRRKSKPFMNLEYTPVYDISTGKVMKQVVSQVWFKWEED